MSGKEDCVEHKFARQSLPNVHSEIMRYSANYRKKRLLNSLPRNYLQLHGFNLENVKKYICNLRKEELQKL